MTTRTLVLAAALALAPLAAARAEEEPPRRWYGWEIMLVDLGAVGTMVLGAATEVDAIAYVGVGAFVIGGPIVHNVHGNRGRGAVSGILRGGLPLAFGVIANASCDEDEIDGFFGCVGEVAGAMVGGALLAMALDYTLLPYETERAPVGVVVAPRRDGGLTVGLSGSF